MSPIELFWTAKKLSLRVTKPDKIDLIFQLILAFPFTLEVKGCVYGGLLIFFRLNIRSIWAAKLTFWKLERGQRLCWCDSGLWGWSAGGSSQGDLGWEGTLLLFISQSSSHQGHCWEAGKRQQLGVDGQASRAKDSTNLIPIRLLSCWNWTIGLLRSWNWTIKYFSL